MGHSHGNTGGGTGDLQQHGAERLDLDRDFGAGGEGAEPAFAWMQSADGERSAGVEADRGAERHPHRA